MRAAGLAGLLAVAAVTTITAAPAAAKIAPVLGVKATPGVAQVTVSWTPLATSGTTYTVTSTPTGMGCTVVDEGSCTLTDESSVPYQFSVVASNASETTPVSKLSKPLKTRLLVVIAGQSNATGLGSFATGGGVSYFSAAMKNGADAVDKLTWEPWQVNPQKGTAATVGLDAVQSTDFWGPKLQIFGPELGLARQVYADTGDALTIVKAADPGTSLGVGWDPSTVGGLYQTMVAKVLSTMAADAAKNQLDVVGGFYWDQGEQDAQQPLLFPVYQSNLFALIDDVRADLPMAPTVPIALVKESLADLIAYDEATGTCPYPDNNCGPLVTGDNTVRAADDAAVADLPNVVEVDSAGMARDADNVHLTDASELTLGEELATATERSFP